MSNMQDESAGDAATIAAAKAMLQPREEEPTTAQEMFLNVDAPPQPMISTSPEQIAAANDAAVLATAEDDLSPDLPPELRELLEEPDEDEDLAEYEAVEPETEQDENEYEDPQVADLRRRAIAAEKKAAHYEKLRVQSARKAWVEEATKYFPLSAPADIQADSRRSFLKAAEARHKAMQPTVERYLDGERAKLRSQARDQWGTPVTSGPQVPSQATQETDAIDQAFNEKGLEGGLRELFRRGKVKI